MMESKFIIEVDEDIDINEEQMSFEDPIPELDDSGDRTLNVRLDKWLWAARFFKTRALARSAVKNGRVIYNGQKATPSKEIEIGDKVIILQPNKYNKIDRAVTIEGLSTRRRSAEEAKKLYSEVEMGNINEEAFSGEFSEQPHLQDTEDSIDSKPRKVVRFLRRAFMRNDEVEVVNSDN